MMASLRRAAMGGFRILVKVMPEQSVTGRLCSNAENIVRSLFSFATLFHIPLRCSDVHHLISFPLLGLRLNGFHIFLLRRTM